MLLLKTARRKIAPKTAPAPKTGMSQKRLPETRRARASADSATTLVARNQQGFPPLTFSFDLKGLSRGICFRNALTFSFSNIQCPFLLPHLVILANFVHDFWNSRKQQKDYQCWPLLAYLRLRIHHERPSSL